MARLTKEQVREKITTTGSAHHNSRVFYDGHQIGSIVAYGHSSAKFRRGNVSSRTVYSTRFGIRIENVEASSIRVLLDRVAAKVAKAIREGNYVPPLTEAPDEELEKFLSTYWPNWREQASGRNQSDLFLVRWNDVKAAFDAGWRAKKCQ
jgi:hypothetical protein